MQVNSIPSTVKTFMSSEKSIRGISTLAAVGSAATILIPVAWETSHALKNTKFNDHDKIVVYPLLGLVWTGGVTLGYTVKKLTKAALARHFATDPMQSTQKMPEGTKNNPQFKRTLSEKCIHWLPAVVGASTAAPPVLFFSMLLVTTAPATCKSVDMWGCYTNMTMFSSCIIGGVALGYAAKKLTELGLKRFVKN